MTSPVIVDRSGPVARVTMSRPEVHNALDERLIAELTDVFTALGVDASIRAVVLTGAGKSFSAGADLAWMQRAATYDEERNRADARALELMLRTLDELEKPTLALVNGAAIGGGMGLVAACDVAIAGERAVFALSEVRLGITPAVIAPFVVHAIGPRHARRYALTAERMTAAQAQTIGLVHEVVPADGLEARGEALLADLLQGGSEAQAETKRLLAMARSMPQGGGILAEATVAMIAERRASEEGREGIAAFLEKRRPRWLG